MNGNDMLNKLIRVEHNIIQEYYKLIMNEMDNRDYNISFTCISELCFLSFKSFKVFSGKLAKI